jgi:hypothetical protein
MVDTTYSSTIAREAPEIEARRLGLMDEARNLYNRPMGLPFVEAAASDRLCQAGRWFF